MNDFSGSHYAAAAADVSANQSTTTGPLPGAASGQHRTPSVSTELTLMNSLDPLSKSISRGPDGTVHSTRSLDRGMGLAQRVRLNSRAELAALLLRLEPKHALILGHLLPHLPDVCRVFLKRDVANGKASAAAGGAPDVISRSLDCFDYPHGKAGELLLDVDLKGLPGRLRERIGTLDTGHAVVALLTPFLPWLANCAWLLRPSTSSNIWDMHTNQPVTDTGGWHGFVPVPDVSVSKQILEIAHKRCVLAGFGWIFIDTAGRMHVRSLIDKSVSSPERLVYEASPTIEASSGLQQSPRNPVWQEGPAADLAAACSPLTAEEERRYGDLVTALKAEAAPKAAEVKQARVKQVAVERGISEEDAQRVVDLWHAGTLDLNFKLMFDDPEIRGHTVADVRRNPDRYVGEHMAAPHQPEKQNRAVLYRNKAGKLWIKSYARGGSSHELAELVQSVLDGHRDRIKKEFPSLGAADVQRTLDALEGRVIRWHIVPDWRDKQNTKLPDTHAAGVPIGYFLTYCPSDIIGYVMAHPLEGDDGAIATVMQTDHVLFVQAGSDVFKIAYRFSDMKKLLGDVPETDVARCFARLVATADDMQPLQQAELCAITVARAQPKVTKADLLKQVKAEEKKEDESAKAAEAERGERTYTEQVAAAIVRMNERYMFVNENGKPWVFRKTRDEVLERDYYERIHPKDDLKQIHMNDVIYKRDGNGIMRLNVVSDLWKSSPHRRQYINGVVFDPGQRYNDPNKLNLWTNWAVTPKKGSWDLMQNHMHDVLCAYKQESYQYLCGWSARVFQLPGVVAETAVVMKGDEGTGKGLFGRAMRYLCGQHGIQVTHAKHLVGGFNAHLRDMILIFADEALFAGNKEHADLLKGLITEPTTLIEGKGRDAVFCPNYAHVIMSSNHDWVVPVSLKDRRMLVLSARDTYRGNIPYFRAIMDQMQRGGYAAMLYDLLYETDLSKFEVRNIPDTAGLQEQKKRSLKIHQAWWYDMLYRGYVENNGSAWQGTMLTETLFSSYTAFARDRSERYTMTREHLGGFLQEMGGSTTRPRDGVKRVQAYAFSDLAETRAIFCRVTGLTVEWPEE